MTQVEKSSRNIKFCAYLKIQKINPIKVQTIARGRGTFFYMIEEERWDQLKINFNNSEFIEYGNAIESLKDLCY